MSLHSIGQMPECMWTKPRKRYSATPRQPLALDWMVAPLPTSTNIKVNVRLSCPLTEPVD